MPPKKKPVVSDDSFGSSDEEVVLKKTPKKKTAPPKKSTPKKAPKTSSAMTGAGGDEGAAENADDKAKLGYSGQYDCEGNALLDVEIPSMAAPVMCADGTGSRLMIKEIIVTNFKSYYGRQRIGPFHKNFSAIIGPNGSGKSNVIDSLLFVFGFRASRIRLKKLKELIHNSSGKETPEFCSVEVVFQKIVDTEGGLYDTIQGSEFTVGRTAYQDSTSKYTINGKTKTKDEIEKKLKEVGIDLVHNRFLILQGEVEQIALMKPKAEALGKEGMLEYLEDIIGSSRLKNYLNDIGLKLEEISTEKSQQNQRVKASEKERDALEGPVREMISHLRCENQATLINNKLLTMKKLRYQTQSEEINPEIEATNEKMKAATDRLDKIVAEKKEAEKEFAHLESEKDGYQKKLATVDSQITALDAKESRRKIDFKRCVKELSTAEEKVKQYQRELEELMKVPESAEARINMLKGEIEELQERVTSNEAKITKNGPLFEEKSAQMREDKQKAEEEKGRKQQVKDDIEGKRHLAKQELDLIVNDANKVQGRLKDLQQQLDDNKKELTNKQEDFDRVRKRLPDCERELDEARAAAPKLKKECDKAKNELISLREKLSDEQSAMQAQSHGSKAGEILADAQTNGFITTYFGRLGDLGAIDAKYDAAVTTTCPGLNAYVLQTKEDGDTALSFIKDAKIGRHHFIVLDGVPDSSNYMDVDPKKFPAPRVFDLLTIPDPRMKKAFYQTFRDTMIVDTMEEARRLFNKQRSRYITLGGGAIEVSGLMSGGGKIRTGGIGSTVRIDTAKNSRNSQELIERMRADEAKKATLLTQLEDNMRKNDQTVFNLSHELQTLRNENRVLTNETSKLGEKVTNLEKQIAFQKEVVGKHQVDEALVEEKREQLKKFDADYECADKELKFAEEGFTKAKDRLDRIWRELCGRFREEVDNARKDIEKAEKDIADQEGKTKSFERDRAKAEARLNAAVTTAEEKTKLQEQLKNQEGEMETDREELVKKQKELQAGIADVDNRIQIARKSTSQHHEEENKLTREIGLLKDKKKEMKEQLAALEHQILQVQKEISGLKMHRIKEYGVLPQKVRQVAHHDHIIDEETLEEEKAHQKRKKQQQKGGDESGDEDSDGDDGAVPVLTADDVKELDKEDLKFKLQLLQEKVRKNKEHLNMRIIGEYTEKVKKYNAEYGVLQKLADAHAKHMQKQEEWKRVRLKEFMEGFTKIGTSLKEMYQMITLGGDAALDLKDSLDPFTEGISFMVRPPKKSWKNMENLSGGEKTLSSLSLVFALHHYRPTPLYVMDEIDAALDFRNVSIIGHYVKDRTKNAQFIIISLRNNMFELGDRLVGIYKTEDCTKNVVVDPAQVMEKAERLKAALKNVNMRVNEQSLRENGDSDEEETDGNAMVRAIRGRKRVSEDSTTSAASQVAEPLKRMDSRLSPASDPGRVSRLPHPTSSSQDSDF